MFRQLAVAFGFLTRFPVPDVSGGGSTPVTDDDLRLATTWFPLVGLVVGALGGAVRWGLDAHLGATTAAVLAVATTVLATGAFHEDGWADTFDGLWGGWTPERRIEIMRDSRVGTYGALALLLVVLAEVSALAHIGDSREAGLALVAAHVLGRLAVLLLIARGEPATDQGSGARVGDPLPPARLATVATTAVAVSGALLLPVVGPAGAMAGLGALVVVVEAARAIAHDRIGGTTGDVLGATATATIATTLLLASAFGSGPA